MTSVTTVMASVLDRELRRRDLMLSAAECEHILRLVIGDTAAIAQGLESSRSVVPPAEPPDGGCIGGDASAVDFYATAAEQLDFLTGEVRKALAIFNALPLPEYFRRNAERDRLAVAIEHASDHLAVALNVLSAHPRQSASGHHDPRIPSSATPAPRTSDGGRDPSGDAPAVTPAQKAYALLWREMPVHDRPFAREARRILLADLTQSEQAAAIAWVQRRHPISGEAQ